MNRESAAVAALAFLAGCLVGMTILPQIEGPPPVVEVRMPSPWMEPTRRAGRPPIQEDGTVRIRRAGKWILLEGPDGIRSEWGEGDGKPYKILERILEEEEWGFSG